jgi:hypothetical protein
VPFVSLPDEDSKQFSRPFFAFMWQLRLGLWPFLRIFDDGRLLDLDQPVSDDFVEGWQNLFDLLRSLDEFNPDRQMFGQNFNLRGVKQPVRTKAGHKKHPPLTGLRSCLPNLR